MDSIGQFIEIAFDVDVTEELVMKNDSLGYDQPIVIKLHIGPVGIASKKTTARFKMTKRRTTATSSKRVN